MSINLYAPPAVAGKLKMFFSIDGACEDIHKACKGMGTNEKTLIKVLGSHSPSDRGIISQRYKELYNQELKFVLRGETSGDFGFLLQMLSVPLPEAEAFVLHQAIEKTRTDEHMIYPILMARSNEEMAILKSAYLNTYGKDLTTVMDAELKSDFKKIIMTVLTTPSAPYDPLVHTAAKADEDAEKIFKAGEKKLGTDELAFAKVLFASPPKHIEAIDAAYMKKHKKGLVEAIQSEFSGDAEKALHFHVRAALEPKALMAEHFESTMKGRGTDEHALSAAVVRYHPYLDSISGAYQVLYQISLVDRIKGEVHGDLKELLLKIMEAETTAPALA